MKILYIFLILILSIGNASASVVSIAPSTQTVSQGQSFTINVTVDPQGSATAGVQFNLYFNNAYVTVNSVTEGNFLKQGGASTYFNAGTINNAAGSITNVYGVITTPGASVSTAGTFATISMTANANGTSYLNLANVIVSSPGGSPIATTINNGSVTVGLISQPLYISVSESPDPVLSGGTSQVTVHVTTTGGTPVSGASVSVSATGGSLSPISGTTDASGDFKPTYTAPTVTATTTYTISASASKTGYTSGSGSDTITVNPPVGAAVNVNITPSTQTVSPGQSFTVNVTVDPQGSATAGVQFNLYFNNAYATVNSVTEGNFLKQGGASTYFNTGTINNAAGSLTNVYGVITTPGASVSNSGVFAIISLTANAAGISPLNLGNVIVSNPNGSAISAAINNGSVTVSSQVPTTVVSISDITIILNKTGVVPIMIKNVTNVASAQIILSYNSSVVHVTGVANSSFDTMFSNIDNATGATTIGAFQITSPGLNGNVKLADVTLRAVGNNKDKSPLNLTIITLADPSANPIPATTSNGTCSLIAGMCGDVNDDGTVDISDAMWLAKHVIGIPGYPINEANSDVNGDGTIDISDAMWLAKNRIGIPGYSLRCSQ